jgi:hypothetical protein
MATHGGARKMTLQQWADLDEDVEGELIDGVIEEEEAPTHSITG